MCWHAFHGILQSTAACTHHDEVTVSLAHTHTHTHTTPEELVVVEKLICSLWPAFWASRYGVEYSGSPVAHITSAPLKTRAMVCRTSGRTTAAHSAFGYTHTQQNTLYDHDWASVMGGAQQHAKTTVKPTAHDELTNTLSKYHSYGGYEKQTFVACSFTWNRGTDNVSMTGSEASKERMQSSPT